MLRLIQNFHGPGKPHHKDLRPFCENEHPTGRLASGYFQDKDGKGHNLCKECAGEFADQEPMYKDWA